MSDWFLCFDEEPLSAAANMARDEFLFHLCHSREMGVLRLYSWRQPSFSFGVSQRIQRALNMEVIKREQLSFVRRITGGKTVLHDDELTYSIVSSERFFFQENDLFKSYLLIAQFLVRALHDLGIDARLSDGSPSSMARSSNPCFSFPSSREIEVKGKKIVGSAQKRSKSALLQHGSIPITMNYDLYSRATRISPALLGEKMTTLSEMGINDRQLLVATIIRAFNVFIEQDLKEFKFSTDDREAIKTLEVKYLSDDWNCSQ